MLRVVTGRFHPDLEEALCRDIGRAKSDDPLAPLAVVVPASSLAAHVGRTLTATLRRPLLNLHVLTFHQLALRLFEERRGAAPESADRHIQVLPDFLFEHLTGHLGRRQAEEGTLRQGQPVGPGGWSVLWRTLRDLRDAQVDPEVALRGVEEGVFAREDLDRLRALFGLHAALDRVSKALEVGQVDDVAAAVGPWVPESRFLHGLARLWYYGFYDLTQVQLTLFEAVAERAPVTLCFPLDDSPASAFARRFFERHISPMLGRGEGIVPARPAEPDSGTRAPRPRVEVFSTVGPEEELTAAARQILSLVETQGCRLDRIGVVARSLEPYQGILRRVFEAHAIPFSSTGALPILPEPSVKVLLALASLRAGGFPREPVLDVVTSPFFLHRAPAGGEARRPDLWRLAARSLGIVRGEADWRKLETAAGPAPRLEGDGEGEDEPDPSPRATVPAPVLRGLWETWSSLAHDLMAIPERGRYDEMTDAFASVAAAHLDIPGLAPDWEAEREADGGRRQLGAAIQRALSWLRQLARLEESPGYEEWLATFVRALEQVTMPIVADDHPGVQVLDAMTARGLSFEALLVLGLNENAFPRTVQEDPFLHDRHRRVLAETLGYKIDEKLNGYAEEQLLFKILTEAAGRHLSLFHQRADAEGRAVAPSPYLAPVLRAGATEVRVPRRLGERAAVALGADALASPGELSLRAVLAGDDPAALLAASGREPALFAQGRGALDHLEGPARRPGGHDGMTGPLDAHWARLGAQGVSPTALERYVTCPFQYFSAQVLRLEDLRLDVPQELPAQAWGTLVHGVLRRCYPSLLARGWPERDLAGAEVAGLVRAAADETFAGYERDQATGYWLAWQLARERVRDLVATVIEQDGEELRRSGYRPVAFETDGRGRLGEALGEPFSAMPVRGRADRVDRRGDPPGLRIVDYKYKQAGTLAGRDKDLAARGVQGKSLQPPLYALIDSWGGGDGAPAPDARRPDGIDFLYVAPNSRPVVQRAAFPATAWTAASGASLRATLRRVLAGIRDGRFFIVPNGYCERCTFTVLCRRSHGPSWQRARLAAEARALRRMRRQSLPEAADDETA